MFRDGTPDFYSVGGSASAGGVFVPRLHCFRFAFLQSGRRRFGIRIGLWTLSRKSLPILLCIYSWPVVCLYLSKIGPAFLYNLPAFSGQSSGGCHSVASQRLDGRDTGNSQPYWRAASSFAGAGRNEI